MCGCRQRGRLRRRECRGRTEVAGGDACGRDQSCCTRVRGDSDILEIDVGHGDCGRTESLAKKLNVRLFFVGDLVHDLLLGRRETRNRGGAADRYRTCRERPGVARRRGGIAAREPRTVRRVKVELCLKIFEVQGEVQNVCIGGGRRSGSGRGGAIVTAAGDRCCGGDSSSSSDKCSPRESLFNK